MRVGSVVQIVHRPDMHCTHRYMVVRVLCAYLSTSLPIVRTYVRRTTRQRSVQYDI